MLLQNYLKPGKSVYNYSPSVIISHIALIGMEYSCVAGIGYGWFGAPTPLQLAQPNNNY